MNSHINTNEEKNVAIAEMFNSNCQYKDKSNESFYFPQWSYDNGESWIWKSDLKFDSDANWQFEALKYIISLNSAKFHHNYLILPGSCGIYRTEVQTGKVIIEIVRDSIFEALYQFSQYLK